MVDLLGSPRVAPLFPVLQFRFFLAISLRLFRVKRYFNGYDNISVGKNLIHKYITRNRVPFSNSRELEYMDPLRWADADTNELFVRRVQRRVHARGKLHQILSDFRAEAWLAWVASRFPSVARIS